MANLYRPFTLPLVISLASAVLGGSIPAATFHLGRLEVWTTCSGWDELEESALSSAT